MKSSGNLPKQMAYQHGKFYGRGNLVLDTADTPIHFKTTHMNLTHDALFLVIVDYVSGVPTKTKHNFRLKANGSFSGVQQTMHDFLRCDLK